MFHTNPLKMSFSPVLFLFQVPQNFSSTSPYPYKASYKWGIKMPFRITASFFFLFMTSSHSTPAVPGLFSSSSGMFRACVQKHQASNQHLILVQTPEKVFFPASFPAKPPRAVWMGQGHGGDTPWHQHPQFHPVGPLHHCTSAQHTNSLSFKGRLNPGISQAFEQLLLRFQPRPSVHPV